MELWILMGPIVWNSALLCLLPLYHAGECLLILALCVWRCHSTFVKTVDTLANYINAQAIQQYEAEYETTRAYMAKQAHPAVLEQKMQRYWPYLTVTVPLWTYLVVTSALYGFAYILTIALYIVLCIMIEHSTLKLATRDRIYDVVRHKRETLHLAYVQAQWLRLEEHLRAAQLTHALSYKLSLAKDELIFVENVERAQREYHYTIEKPLIGTTQLHYCYPYL
jgi:hypothetical protein